MTVSTGHYCIYNFLSYFALSKSSDIFHQGTWVFVSCCTNVLKALKLLSVATEYLLLVSQIGGLKMQKLMLEALSFLSPEKMRQMSVKTQQCISA